MLSRVANSIYWMCRYIERAENVARFISVNLNLLLDMPTEEGRHWKPLVMTTGDHELFEKKDPKYSQEAVIRFLTFDQDYPNSIVRCLGSSTGEWTLHPRDYFIRNVGTPQQFLP